jgi:membrane-associated phospholipid phosphatase
MKHTIHDGGLVVVVVVVWCGVVRARVGGCGVVWCKSVHVLVRARGRLKDSETRRHSLPFLHLDTRDVDTGRESLQVRELSDTSERNGHTTAGSAAALHLGIRGCEHRACCVPVVLIWWPVVWVVEVHGVWQCELVGAHTLHL